MKKEVKNSSAEENKGNAAPVEAAAEEKAAAAEEIKVGALLKAARLKEGKKISDISQKLCIRKVYLEAIEAADYANVPDYPYGPGFIRSYAEYLGLDGEELVEKFKAENDAYAGRNQPIFVPEPQAEATVPGRKYLLISLLAIIAVYAGWYFYNDYQNLPVDEPLVEDSVEVSGGEDFPLVVEDFAQVDENLPAETQTVPVLTVIDTTAAPETTETPQVKVTEGSFDGLADQEETVKPAPAEKTAAEVVLKFKTDTWIEVKNDAIVYISKVLKSGEEYTLPRDKDLRLSTGNAGGFDIFINGVEQPAVGSSGMVKKNISVNELLSAARH